MEPPDPTLYIRWAQWGLLSSHSRFHGVRGREPWWFGDEAVEVVRCFARLRYRLLPYLWSCANEAVATALPLVRPLLLEYPDDPTAATSTRSTCSGRGCSWRRCSTRRAASRLPAAGPLARLLVGRGAGGAALLSA